MNKATLSLSLSLAPMHVPAPFTLARYLAPDTHVLPPPFLPLPPLYRSLDSMDTTPFTFPLDLSRYDPAKLKTARYTLPDRLSSDWSEPSQREHAERLLLLSKAAYDTAGGRSPIEATLALPVHNDAFRAGKIPLSKLVEAAQLRDKALRKEISTYEENKRLEGLGKPRQVSTIGQSPLLHQEGLVTQTQRRSAIAASQPSVNEWYARTAEKIVAAQKFNQRTDLTSAQQSYITKLARQHAITQLKGISQGQSISDEQLAAIIDPSRRKMVQAGGGSGKSAVLGLSIVEDIVNKGVNPSSMNFYAMTHSALNAPSDVFKRIEKLIPQFDLARRKNATSTVHSLGLRMLNARTVQGDNGSLVSPISVMSGGTLKNYTPLGQENRQYLNAEQAARAMKTQEQAYFQDAIDQYGIKGVTNTGDIFKRIQDIKTSASRSSELYKSVARQGKADWNDNKRTTPDALFHMYENTLKYREGYRVMPKQRNPHYDLADSITLAANAAAEGLGPRLKYAKIDEFQDLSPEMLRLFKEIADPNARLMLAGDMGQKTIKSPTRIDEFAHKILGDVSEHQLTGNYRSGPWTTALVRMIGQEPILSGRSGSPPQISMRSSLDLPFTSRVGETYKETYQSMVHDMLSHLGLSPELVGENIKSGQHPLTGATSTVAQAPYVGMMHDQRKLFRQQLQDTVAGQVGHARAVSAMEQMYTERTPEKGDSSSQQMMIHALLESQVRSRATEHPFIDTTRVGQWNDADYLEALQTLVSRASVQPHLYQSMQNMPGANFDLTPDTFLGQRVPQNFGRWAQASIEHLQQVYGLTPEQMAPALQHAMGTPVLSQTQSEQEDLASTASFMKDLAEIKQYHQQAVGSGVGGVHSQLEAGAYYQDDTSEEGGRSLLGGLSDKGALNAATMSGAYKRGPDLSAITFAREQMRNILQQGQSVASSLPKNLTELIKSPVFSRINKRHLSGSDDHLNNQALLSSLSQFGMASESSMIGHATTVDSGNTMEYIFPQSSRTVGSRHMMSPLPGRALPTSAAFSTSSQPLPQYAESLDVNGNVTHPTLFVEDRAPNLFLPTTFNTMPKRDVGDGFFHKGADQEGLQKSLYNFLRSPGSWNAPGVRDILAEKSGDSRLLEHAFKMDRFHGEGVITSRGNQLSSIRNQIMELRRSGGGGKSDVGKQIEALNQQYAAVSKVTVPDMIKQAMLNPASRTKFHGKVMQKAAGLVAFSGSLPPALLHKIASAAEYMADASDNTKTAAHYEDLASQFKLHANRDIVHSDEQGLTLQEEELAWIKKNRPTHGHWLEKTLRAPDDKLRPFGHPDVVQATEQWVTGLGSAERYDAEQLGVPIANSKMRPYQTELHGLAQKHLTSGILDPMAVRAIRSKDLTGEQAASIQEQIEKERATGQKRIDRSLSDRTQAVREQMGQSLNLQPIRDLYASQQDPQVRYENLRKSYARRMGTVDFPEKESILEGQPAQAWHALPNEEQKMLRNKREWRQYAIKEQELLRKRFERKEQTLGVGIRQNTGYQNLRSDYARKLVALRATRDFTQESSPEAKKRYGKQLAALQNRFAKKSALFYKQDRLPDALRQARDAHGLQQFHLNAEYDALTSGKIKGQQYAALEQTLVARQEHLTKSGLDDQVATQFESLGASVPLESFEKRMRDMVLSGTLPRGQARLALDHMYAVQNMRHDLTSEDFQRYGGHFMNVLGYATMGKGAVNRDLTNEMRQRQKQNGTYKEEGIDVLFKHQRKQFEEGGRTFAASQEFVSALNEGITHLHTTGTIKRGHIDRILGALGHSPSSPEFAALKGLERQFNFTGEEATLPVEQIAMQAPNPQVQRNLLGEMTRMPFRPGEDAVYMGGMPGFTDVSQMHPSTGLQAGMVGYLAPYIQTDQYGEESIDPFGVSKQLSEYRKDGGAMMTREEFKKTPFEKSGLTPMEPMYRFVVPGYGKGEPDIVHLVRHSQLAGLHSFVQGQGTNGEEGGDTTSLPSSSHVSSSRRRLFGPNGGALQTLPSLGLFAMSQFGPIGHAFHSLMTHPAVTSLLAHPALPALLSHPASAIPHLAMMAMGGVGDMDFEGMSLAERIAAKTEMAKKMASQGIDNASIARAQHAMHPQLPPPSSEGFFDDLEEPLSMGIYQRQSAPPPALPPLQRPTPLPPLKRPTPLPPLVPPPSSLSSNPQLAMYQRELIKWQKIHDQAKSAYGIDGKDEDREDMEDAKEKIESYHGLIRREQGKMAAPPPSASASPPSLPPPSLPPPSLPIPSSSQSQGKALVGMRGRVGSRLDVHRWTTRGSKRLGVPPPSDEQLAFMRSPERMKVLEGGPGSGKTGTLARTMAYLANQNKILPRNVLALSTFRSAVSKFNEGLDPYRKMFPQHDKAYQFPSPITYHSLAAQTVFPSMDDGTGAIISPMLKAMGLGHLTGQILTDPTQDEKLMMTPQEQQRAYKMSKSEYVRSLVQGHTSNRVSDWDLDTMVKHIGEVKKNRGTGSPYEDSMARGAQGLAAGDMNPHVALSLYESARNKAGLLDYDDIPTIAANMYEQYGAKAVPARFQGTGIVGMDEGQDQNFEVARMMKGFLGGISQNNPHTIVGLDLMQSLTQGMGGAPISGVRRLYRTMLGLPGKDEPFHQLTKNFRSSVGDIAFNNAILGHPTLAGEPRSPAQVPGLPSQDAGQFPQFLASRSQPSLYRKMFGSMLNKAGISPTDIVKNVKAGVHPLTGGSGASPSQIPAIFSRNQDEELFGHVARQHLEAAGLSSQEAAKAWGQMYRTGTPGVSLSDEQKEAAQGQFWGLTHRGARAWDWQFPHVDTTRFAGFDPIGNLRNLFVGASRVKGGQNTFGAASHTFSRGQLKQYIRGVDFQDSNGEVLLDGKPITPSKLNSLTNYHGTPMTSQMRQLMEARHQGMIALGVDPHDAALGPHAHAHAHAQTQTQAQTQTKRQSPPSSQWGRNPPPPPPLPTLAQNANVQINNAQIKAQTVTVTPAGGSPGSAPTTAQAQALAQAGGSGASTPTLPAPANGGMGSPMPPVSAHAMARQNGGGGNGNTGGGGGGGDGGESPWNNAISQFGRTAARIGYEMQFVGKTITQNVALWLQEGSSYRRATFGLSGSGADSTGGFYNFNDTGGNLVKASYPAGTIGAYQQRNLPMFSKTQIVQGYQALTGMSNNPQIGYGALTGVMGLSALSGIDSNQLTSSLAYTGGVSGQGNSPASYGNTIGMLYGMYGNNLSQANISPTLQGLQSVLPTMQGMAPGSTTQAAQVMALFQTALNGGMSTQNLPDVANTIGAMANLGSNPDLQQQYALQQMGYTMTADPQLAQFRSDQTQRSMQLSQLQLEQNINGRGLSLPQLNIQIDQAQITMEKANLDMQGLQVGAAQIAQQGAQLNYQYARADYGYNLSVQNALYGPIGADRSQMSGFSLQQNQLVAQRDPLNAQIGTVFQPSQVSGLRNQEFYAGLQNQQQSLILQRSPLLSDALFQQQMKYIGQQAKFYQEELAITNATRAFNQNWQGKLLDQQGKAVAYNAKIVAQQGYIYSLQQKQYGLDVAKAQYDEKSQLIQQRYLAQQAGDLSALIAAFNQQMNGQGPINGGLLQPMDLITKMAQQYKGNDAGLNTKALQLFGNDPADRAIFIRLVKATEQNPGQLQTIFNQMKSSDQQSFLKAFQTAQKNGLFNDLVSARTVADASLAQGGTGPQWDALTKSLKDISDTMPQLAKDFAWMSSLAPWAGLIISYAGTAMVVMGTIMNSLGFLQGLANFFKTWKGGVPGGGGLGGLPGDAGTLTTGGEVAGSIGAAILPVVGVAVAEFLLAKWMKDQGWIPDAPKTGPTWVTHQPTQEVKNWPWQNPDPNAGTNARNRPTQLTAQQVKDGALLDQAKTNTANLVQLYKQQVTYKPIYDQIQKGTIDTALNTKQQQVNELKMHQQHMAKLDQVITTSKANTTMSITASGHDRQLITGYLNTGNQYSVNMISGIKNNATTTGHGFSTMGGKQDASNKTLSDSYGVQKNQLTQMTIVGNVFSGIGIASSKDTTGGGGMNHGLMTPHVNADFHDKMWYGLHQGVDFNAAQGTPLKAFDGGKVVGSGWHPWGGEIDVQIANTPFIERYLHLSELNAGVGETVKRGQFIGLTGGGTPQSGLGFWSHGAHSHVQIDEGNINAALDPWPIWAALGDANISQYYGFAGLGFGTQGKMGGAGGVGGRGELSQQLAGGGIAMRRMKADLADGGEPEAVIPLSKLSMVMSSTPQHGGQSGAHASHETSGSRHITISKLVDHIEMHVHTAATTLDDHAKDDLMAQVLEVFGQAAERFAGKLNQQ